MFPGHGGFVGYLMSSSSICVCLSCRVICSRSCSSAPPPPQGYAAVVHSFADTPAPSLVAAPTLHVVGNY